MSAKVLRFSDDVKVSNLALYLADTNGEDWAAITDERWAQLEHIARLALSAVKGSDRG